MIEEAMSMDLLQSYVKAVRRYLPRAERDDIVAELSEDLRSEIEAREADLDRPLRDDEQMAVFTAHGDPMIVARRYRGKGMSLSIGWELIGPELFPMYLIILGLNTILAVGIGVAIMLYIHLPLSLGTLLRPALIQLVCVTLTFIILNLVRRKFPQPWYYPPAELARMLPIPSWISISGLVVWITFTLWWAAIPLFPRLLLGSAAGYLELAPPWHRFYLPILLLLAAGIAQRALNLARPSWNALLPATRLLINAVALGLQYPMIRSYPYVVVARGATDPAHASVANAFNGSILWGVLSWMWIYHLISAVIYAWYCAPFLRRAAQQLLSSTGSGLSLKKIL
jgi:hypothetical protein